MRDKESTEVVIQTLNHTLTVSSNSSQTANFHSNDTASFKFTKVVNKLNYNRFFEGLDIF